MPNEEGHAVRENKAMHEENFGSNWLKEDERGKEERMTKAEKEEERGEKRKREEETEETETGTVNKRCQGFVSVEAFDLIWSREDLESCADLSWEDPLEEFENWSDCEPDSRARVRMVPDKTDVAVSSCSVVTVLVMFPPVARIGNLWNRSPFLSPKSGFGQLRRKR